MAVHLRTSDPELRDLAAGSPRLVDASSGRLVGATLGRWLGAGGMSAVFSAEVDPSARSESLSPLSPAKIAIKILKPSLKHEAARLNFNAADVFTREVTALERMMSREPRTALVVGYFGSGQTEVEVNGQVETLPWLAIELVDGGVEGVTLTERVRRAAGQGGVDPVRALRLARGIFEGVRELHAAGIIHRDLKPDNVLIAGPLDDEVPKLSDCGIARIDGLAGTIAAMTPSYGGPEQTLSRPWERNPLIGPWTDVHALAAIVWFILGGEAWCAADGDVAWHRGARRSLLSAPSLHRAFVLEHDLFAELDKVLARGAAPRVPAAAWEGVSTGPYEAEAKRLYPKMFTGDERFATTEAFGRALLPLLERCAALWQDRCALEDCASTAFRKTQPLDASHPSRPLAEVREVASMDEALAAGVLRGDAPSMAAPGSAVFLPDGKILARFGAELFYYVGDRPHRVVVPQEHRAAVAESKWLVRGPAGSFALIGPSHVLRIRSGKFSSMPLPARPSGGEVGIIEAALGTASLFAIVTAETDDGDGGAELWTSSDGATWAAPILLPLGGSVHSVAYGPYGYLVVGSRRGARGRALFLSLDHHANVYVTGVNDRPPLKLALCGAAREAWAAGDGFVLAFQRGAVSSEIVEASGAPAALALDLIGSPWLVTDHGVARRHVESGVATWRTYYARDDRAAPLIGIGFASDGACVLDAKGNLVRIRTPESR